jgi:hypothetical protein
MMRIIAINALHCMTIAVRQLSTLQATGGQHERAARSDYVLGGEPLILRCALYYLCSNDKDQLYAAQVSTCICW